jgi:hypothetical protein
MDDLRSAGPGRRFWLAALVLSVLVAASACLTASPDPGDTPPAIQEILAQKLEPKLRRAEAQPAPYMYPSEAQEFFALKRVPAAATSIPVERYLQATDHATRMPQHSIPMDSLLPPRAEMPIAPAVAAALGGWTPLGPGNVGGRTRAILIDPLVPTTMYAAGVAGGVWKTTDGGTTWFPLADLIANIAVNSMAMDPADPNTVYAGTGEGYFNIDQVRGAGIFKTTDGGAYMPRPGPASGDPATVGRPGPAFTTPGSTAAASTSRCGPISRLTISSRRAERPFRPGCTATRMLAARGPGSAP